MLTKTLNRSKIHKRIRSKISGTSIRPRLAVFRSNSNIYAQLIDDTSGKTLAHASDLKLKKSGTKTEMSTKVGEDMASKINSLKITHIVFDRGGFSYHGRVKALAEALRSKGVQF